MSNQKKENYFLKSNDPNTQAISSTTEYAVLKEKWKAYLNDENDHDQKGNYLIEFCSFYLSIIKTKIAIMLVHNVSVEIIKEGIKFNDNYEVFSKCVETLFQIKDLFQISKLDDYLLTFFYSFLKCMYKFDAMIPQSASYFESIFSKREIASDLGNSTFLELCIPEYFCKYQSIIVAQYIQLLLSTQINFRFYETINPRKTMKMIISCMNYPSLQELIKPQISILFCTFYQKLSSISKNLTSFIYDNNGLKYLELLLNSENRPFFYSLLIMTNNDDRSPPPNSKNLNYVYTYYKNNENDQSAIFDMIFTLTQTDSILFTKINSIVPIKKWFDSSKINTRNALILTTTAYQMIPEDTIVLLEHFFKLLDRDKSCVEVSTYLKCFNLIDNLFAKRLVSLKNLDSLNFLKIFVLNPESSQLAEFFTKAPTFAQLTLDIFAYNQVLEIKEQVFNSIVSLHDYFEKKEHFISLCSALFVILPTKTNCKRLVKEIEDSQKYYMVIIFSVSFPKSVELTDNFIDLNLHKWVSNLFDQKLISIDLLSNLFAALVVQKPYRELNDFIDSFDKSHPIFSLDKETIDKIVYGLKEIDIYPHRPIRVTSLFHLLDCPERCSPYNAWVIGKFCLSHFEDFEKVPLLPCVANRFMHFEDVERAMNYPNMFEQFCDLSYDHFSMFQFYGGNEEMIIDFNFTTISFWFVFSEELLVDVPIFHTNNLFFYLNNTTLTAICNGQTIVVDATPTNWTHVFIRLESSLMSQTIKITLNNENTFSFTLKTKITEFTNASFSAAIGSPMMFLGSAIRLSSISPKDFSMIFKNGPGYIEPSNELEETLLVTPFALSNVKMPLNCFPVPYMGFPIHNLSNHNFKVMLRRLREADNLETYNIVFRAICNVNKITNNNNKKFWKQFLESIKHAKFCPSTDLLKSALSTVVNSQNCEKIFSTILYGNEIWDMINNESLICAIFDSFPMISWNNFQDSDVFLAKIVEKNPKSSTIINKIFVNWKKVPKTLKLIVDILKTAAITNWESTQQLFRPESQLQFTIIECILNIIDKKNYEVFKPYFPFDELRYMFITASSKLAVQFFHLIVVFSAFIVDFIQLDSSFLCKVASLCNFPSIWNDSMFLVSGDPDCKNEMILRPSLIPILLHLIWSGSTLIYHSNKHKIENSKIATLLEKVIHFITPLIPQLISQQDKADIFLTYFPVILHYEYVFDEKFSFNNIQSPEKIPQLSISNLSEKDDPVWIDLISRIKQTQFQGPPPVLSSKSFLQFILSQFIIFPNEEEKEKEEGEEKTNNCYLPQFINDFLCDLVLNSGINAIQMAMSIFVWYPYSDELKPQPYVKDFIHNILKRCQTNHIGIALAVTLFFAQKHYLYDDSKRIIKDLFLLCNSTIKANGKESLNKYMNTIIEIFIEIFSKVPTEDYDQLFKVIHKNIQLFSQMALNTKTIKAWIYVFSIAFKDLDGLYDVIFFLYRLHYQEEEKKDPPQLTDEIIHDYHSEWEQKISNIAAKATIVIPSSSLKLISDTSLEFTKKSYIANCKHYLVRCLLNSAFLFIDSSFPIFIEKYKWSNFILLQTIMRSSQSKFNPKCFHLSPKCEPFYPPRVLAPSPYPYINDENFKQSSIFKLFNDNFKVQWPQRNKKTLLNLFYSKFAKLGPPNSILECNFFRYTKPIPSVSFWFSQSIVLLLNARMKQNEIFLIDEESINPKDRHIFIESVILGHFGKTSLFLSHVVVIIPVYSILYAYRYKQTDLAFWTFHSGHFILQFEADSVKQISGFLDKINKIAVDSYPLENYLTQQKTISQLLILWKKKKISTVQLLYGANSLSKRSYVDLDNYPFMPIINNETEFSEKGEFCNGKTVSSILSRILPFRYFTEDKYPYDISGLQALPAIILALPEVLTDINNFGVGNYDITGLARSPHHLIAIFRSLIEDPENYDKLMNWIKYHFTFPVARSKSLDPRMLSQISEPAATTNEQVQNQEQNQAQRLPQLKNLLERQKTTVISISRRLSRLTLVNNLTDKVLFKKTHPLYGLAESISASVDGVFFVIDFAFGITRCYKIICSGGAPIQAKCISSFSIGPKPISSISGYDWICASASGSRLALWEIVTGTVHRLIDFESKVTAVSFNESDFFIWVSVASTVKIVGINGCILADKKVCIHDDDKVTALTNIKGTKKAFCGTEKGMIFMLSFDLSESKIEAEQLESDHKNPIEKIIIQRTIRQYLSLDETGMIEKWDTEGKKIKDESPIFTACAVCTNPTHELCQFCNKPICPQCMPKHLKGPNCRHVTAFI